jgi:alpha-amylase/alpha-mannosidase (GH57 family)
MLVEAKKVYDEVMAEGSLNDHEIERAEMQLATCESSDWFWWFGDYNPAESVRAFDKQYRLHLSNLYLSLHRNPPEYLSRGFSSGSEESRQSGVMLPGKQN